MLLEKGFPVGFNLPDHVLLLLPHVLGSVLPPKVHYRRSGQEKAHGSQVEVFVGASRRHSSISGGGGGEGLLLLLQLGQCLVVEAGTGFVLVLGGESSQS